MNCEYKCQRHTITRSAKTSGTRCLSLGRPSETHRLPPSANPAFVHLGERPPLPHLLMSVPKCFYHCIYLSK